MKNDEVLKVFVQKITYIDTTLICHSIKRPHVCILLLASDRDIFVFVLFASFKMFFVGLLILLLVSYT